MEGSPLGDGTVLRPSGIFSPDVIEDIQVKAELGRYRIRGFGTLRRRPLPSFDDMTFLACTLTRIPLEGYREKCSTKTVLGTRFAGRPIELEIPVMITGMSYGALSYNAKGALAQGATAVGTSTTTGDGGMLAAEREHSEVLIYEVLPSRYGMDVHHLKVADGIELTVGQGAKPGTGACCSAPRCRARSRGCGISPRVWTNGARAAIPTGLALTTWSSRSRSSARPPTGRFPSS